MQQNQMIRSTEICDIQDVLKIYDKARAFMRATGNHHQWSEGYPSRQSLEADIKEGCSYVVEMSGVIVASFYFKFGEEPTYKQIFDGQWLNDAPYGVIHRAASDGTVNGMMKTILDFCLTKCSSIRIDTHRDNKVMRRALISYGLEYCGIIHLANGDERLAYQLS